ncbi:metal ABC transporter solute-binding protein, Zn/Mn family [Reyranella sp.]|uniref:metal ABC transporter solute-binding protein, Zn/Mn family n=1 Tax=Reyranella sp. TaxID=1929291 RepID=UPI003783B00A
MLRRSLLAAATLLAVRLVHAEARLRVVATFSIMGDLVREVGGDRVDLAVLVGPDIDAHTYQPKPSDVRVLPGAQVLVSNGLGFEGWIDRLAESAPFKGKRVVASSGVATLAAGGHSHGHGPDPHCWQDAGRVKRYVANIAEGLAAADAANAGLYRDRAVAYSQRLDALDRWVRAAIAEVPAGQRKVITGHDSFRYFTNAYGVQFLAPRGFKTDSEPTARDVAALIRQVREQKIRALFVENMTNPGLVDQIAREAGAAVGARLYSDALSATDGPAATYEALMRHNVTALVAGMMKN